jgi:hypothetical protein
MARYEEPSRKVIGPDIVRSDPRGGRSLLPFKSEFMIGAILSGSHRPIGVAQLTTETLARYNPHARRAHQAARVGLDRLPYVTARHRPKPERRKEPNRRVCSKEENPRGTNL